MNVFINKIDEESVCKSKRRYGVTERTKLHMLTDHLKH